MSRSLTITINTFFTRICKPHRWYPGSTGPLSIDQIDKQGYISRITAVEGNLLVRLSSRDFNNANSEIHNPTDDAFVSPPTIIVSIDLRHFLRGGGGVVFGLLHGPLISLCAFEKDDHVITSSMTTS